jgi:hypothetical protein
MTPIIHTTRIRYLRNNENGFYYSKPILAGREMVVVTIMPEKLSYTISTIETSAVLFHDTGKNLPDLKRRAKEALKAMGANFNPEVRRPGLN